MKAFPRCPKCRSYSKIRVKRRQIIKLIPRSKTYVCDICETRYTWISFVNQSLRI